MCVGQLVVVYLLGGGATEIVEAVGKEEKQTRDEADGSDRDGSDALMTVMIMIMMTAMVIDKRPTALGDTGKDRYLP